MSGPRQTTSRCATTSTASNWTPKGFAKLSEEIYLDRLEYPAERIGAVTLYTGKVPTASGRYQRLVIREAAVPQVDPETMEVIGPTGRNYYEVCTNPAVCEFASSRG